LYMEKNRKLKIRERKRGVEGVVQGGWDKNS
jgi:hypothetical protein